MTIFEFLNKCTSVIQPILGYSVAIFVVITAYGYVNNQDFEDDGDTVTITFRCANVLGSQEQFPDFVVQQCKQVRMR